MRKFLGYFLIFVAGIIFCALIIRLDVFHHYSTSASKAEVLRILDEKPIAVNIPDNALVKAAAKIEPAVVNIDVAGERRAEVFDLFGEPVERSYIMEGKGSGVIISPDGYIVTNEHVIEGSNIIRVSMTNGKQYDGRLIGADRDADIAVVKINAHHLPTAELGDSSILKVGEYVIAIGNPLGIGTTVTHGIISATNRRNLVVGNNRILKQAIQTDAPINRGNSGGALANIAGQLIGINSAIASERGGGNIGIGFAIPINAARSIIKQLIEKGSAGPQAPSKPFIGIVYRPLPPELGKQLRLPNGVGVEVVDVRPLTPAEDAGIRPGDIIVAIDGMPVKDQNTIRQALRKHHIGDVILMKVIRTDGSRMVISIRLGRAPVGYP